MSKRVQVMLRSPSAMMRFQRTGQLPRERKITRTPLFIALDKIGPRCRQVLRGFTVDHRVGYTGHRVFHTADQAFRWLGGYEGARFDCQPRLASESWVDWRFQGHVGWEQIRAAVSGSIGQEVEDRITRSLLGR